MYPKDFKMILNNYDFYKIICIKFLMINNRLYINLVQKLV